MNWRNLYPGLESLGRYPGYWLGCITTASATLGVLYFKSPYETYFQYLAAVASVLYFIGRLAFSVYYRVTLTTNEMIAYIFVFATAFALVGQYTQGMDVLDQDNISSFSYTSALWFFNVSYFFAAGACTRVDFKKSNIIAIAMVALVVYPLWTALEEGELFLDYYKMRIATGNDNFSHLYIAEWCVFFFIGAYGFAKPLLRPFIIIIAFVCLFSLSGRSSTIFTTAALLIFSVISLGRKTILLFIGIAIITAIAYVYLPVEDVLFEADKKELEEMLFSGDELDDSFEARGEIFWFSIKHLPKAALFGDPTFLALEAKRMGSYIHNLLSMWQFFGVVPFVLMVVMLYKSLWIMKRRISEGNLSVMEEIACILLIYATISVIASKSVSFYWLWFAAGYWMLRYSVESHAGDGEPVFKPRRKRSKRRRSMPRRFSF